MTQTKSGGFNPENKVEDRFEFVFYINNNIICQRFFPIKDFDEESVNLTNLKDLMDNIVGTNNGQWGESGIIPKFLKDKSIEYLWSNYNPYQPQREEISKNVFEKINNFQFEIKIDKKTVVKSEFNGNYYQIHKLFYNPLKSKYDVNIRDIIPQIISEIKFFLGQKNYSNA